MDVILLERVEKLGQMGDVVTVKPGFARNYLLPRKKALRATKNNLAEKVAVKVDGLTVPVIRAAGESGQLYGSVTARDIAEAVIEAGVTISRQQVVLDRALKTLGLEKVRISLHAEVDATVIVNIARSSDEAEQQASLGRAVGVDESDLDEQDEDELDSLMAEVAPEAEAGAESAEDAPEAAAGDAEEAAEDADPTAS